MRIDSKHQRPLTGDTDGAATGKLKYDLRMSMNKRPAVLEFIEALMRWLFLVSFSQKHRNEKGLFKKILASDRPLGKESWEAFFLNLFFGIITVALLVTVIVICLIFVERYQ
jgi:hypothetical protein